MITSDWQRVTFGDRLLVSVFAEGTLGEHFAGGDWHCDWQRLDNNWTTATSSRSRSRRSSRRDQDARGLFRNITEVEDRLIVSGNTREFTQTSVHELADDADELRRVRRSPLQGVLEFEAQMRPRASCSRRLERRDLLLLEVVVVQLLSSRCQSQCQSPPAKCSTRVPSAQERNE